MLLLLLILGSYFMLLDIQVSHTPPILIDLLESTIAQLGWLFLTTIAEGGP